MELDHRDTLTMKGLAISAVVFHNYFHLLRDAVRENEFDFDPNRIQHLVRALPDPALAVQALFSFFGHFGVQVFIFLSGYGLAKSYWESGKWGEFFWGRVRKLYPVFGVVVLPWFFMNTFVQIPAMDPVRGGLNLLLMSIGVLPFVPGEGLPPIGPWWFIPFALQLYALWPLLRRMTARYGPKALLIAAGISLALIYTVNPFLMHWSIDLLESPIGRLPTLCLGVFAARYPVQPRLYFGLVAFVLLILGSIYRALWPITLVSALIVFVVLYCRVRRFLRPSSFLQMLGRYSLLVFLLNGAVRFYFYPFATSPSMELISALACAATTLALAVLIQWLLAPSLVANLDRRPLKVAQ